MPGLGCRWASSNLKWLNQKVGGAGIGTHVYFTLHHRAVCCLPHPKINPPVQTPVPLSENSISLLERPHPSDLVGKTKKCGSGPFITRPRTGAGIRIPPLIKWSCPFLFERGAQSSPALRLCPDTLSPHLNLTSLGPDPHILPPLQPVYPLGPTLLYTCPHPKIRAPCDALLWAQLGASCFFLPTAAPPAHSLRNLPPLLLSAEE